MPEYAVTVAIVIFICSIISFFIYRKKDGWNIWVFFSISTASLIAALAVPMIYRLIVEKGRNLFTAWDSIYFAAAVIGIYFVAVCILSLAVTIIASMCKKKKLINNLQPEAGITANGEIAVQDTESVLISGQENSDKDLSQSDNNNYLEQVFDKIALEHNREITNIEENTVNNEINFEKSVDRTEIIDKMGIENIGQDSEKLGIEECIDKAFSLKEENKAESAILYYMYALDKKPGKDLAFLIVLDICVLYKDLGQKEMALDILNSYYDIYGDVMDISVKEEIEKNLQDEQYAPKL